MLIYVTGVYDLFEILEIDVIWYYGCKYLWVMFKVQDPSQVKYCMLIGPTLLLSFDPFLIQHAKKDVGTKLQCRKDPQAQCSSSAISPLPGFCSPVL